MTILGLDLGINRTGWCLGTGAMVPLAGAWVFNPTGDSLGALGDAFSAKLLNLPGGAIPDVVLYEAPFLDRYRDKVIVLRKTYGLGFWLETWCRSAGIICEEVPFGKVKRELGGSATASKEDMVAAAKKCGVNLPPNANQGMEDAADAFGVWLIGVRLYARQFQPAWDRRLYSPRGALL